MARSIKFPKVILEMSGISVSNPDPYMEPGEQKMTHKNKKKLKNFML
jgi:hypothetical protein